MASTKPLRALTALAAVSGALAVAPGPAGAAEIPTFCVNVTACPAGGSKVSLEPALAMARAGAGHAEILIGPKPDGSPYVGPFTYPSASAGNTVNIVGQGRPVLTSDTAGKPVLSLGGPGFNGVSGIDVVVPALPGADGLRLDGTTAFDVHVRGGGAASGINRGVMMSAKSDLTQSSVELKTGFAVELVGGPSGIDASTLTAPFGVIGGASDLRIDDSRVHTEHTGIQLVGGSGGDGGPISDGLTVVGSEITTSAADGKGIYVRDARVELIRTTVASRSAAPLPGRAAVTVEVQEEDAKVFLKTSVLGGYPRPLARLASGGHHADLSVTDSEWDSARDADVGDAAGPRVFKNLVQAEPRFVDRVGGDLRLRGGDGAIDLNSDPLGADSLNTGNLGDVKVNDGDGDGTIRSDAGAYEYARIAPVITGLDVAAPEFAAKAIDADGEAVELAWAFGDGTPKAKGSRVSHAYAPGTYTCTLSARDEAGLETTKAFTVTIAPPVGDGPKPPAGGSTGPVAPSGGTDAGTGPLADRTAPVIRLARVKRGRGRRAKLTVDVTEAATLKITIGSRTRTIRVKAGRSARVLKALPRRRASVRIVAVDAAGNRSAARKLRLKARR